MAEQFSGIFLASDLDRTFQVKICLIVCKWYWVLSSFLGQGSFGILHWVLLGWRMYDIALLTVDFTHHFCASQKYMLYASSLPTWSYTLSPLLKEKKFLYWHPYFFFSFSCIIHLTVFILKINSILLHFRNLFCIFKFQAHPFAVNNIAKLLAYRTTCNKRFNGKY